MRFCALVALLVLICNCCSFRYHLSPASIQRAAERRISPSSDYESRKAGLKSILAREYISFFNPFESSYYAKDVQFIDPLNDFTGIEKYKNNVDMLGGRTLIGSILFQNARINLHSVDDVEPNKLRTRWTLTFCFKILPWQPNPIFTGISEYTLNEEGLIARQNDYWDSVNLEKGRYFGRDKFAGLIDFVGQLLAKKDAGSQQEMPFELLQRERNYEVRRYPRMTVASTQYLSRAEGYGELGSYADGLNHSRKKLSPLSPCILHIPTNGSSKRMSWPMGYEMPNGTYYQEKTLPAPIVENVTEESIEESVVAVVKFSDPSTEKFVRYYASQLDQFVRSNGMSPLESAKSQYTVAQYDAVYSLGTKRNEVWIPLAEHFWNS